MKKNVIMLLSWSFSIYRKIFKEENKLKLAKLNNTTIYTTSNGIKNFGILSIKNKEAIGEKAMKSDLVDVAYLYRLYLFF